MSSSSGSTRVLGLITEAYGAAGGIAQYNRDFYEALVAAPGIGEVHLLPRGGLPNAPHPSGRIVSHRPQRARLVYSVTALVSALRLKPDIVVCGHLFMVALAALAARLCGAKLVVQLHGIEIWRELGAVRRRALEAADLVLCVSRDTRAHVLAAANMPPARVLVLPNTVADEFSPGASTSSRKEAAPRILLSVGRLDSREAYKGHDAVIACLPQIAQLGHDIIYQIAGEGDDRARLQRLAQEQGVEDRVQFLGFVPADALPDLYRAADLFVLASRGEGFGIVFLEAMACGTPALGLAFGGAVDALESLGRAVMPEQLVTAIADELERSAGGRSVADRLDLAARVRARFGRALFNAGVARAVARLGIGVPQEASNVAAPTTDSAGASA